MGTKRILVVDDELPIIELLEEILVAAGYELDSAQDAAGALALVRENIYDAAILDFQLPDMNGMMLHREIRQMDVELADNTLFISGATQTESNLDYFHAFGSGFLPKPFQVEDVLKSLNALWSGEEEAAIR